MKGREDRKEERLEVKGGKKKVEHERLLGEIDLYSKRHVN